MILKDRGSVRLSPEKRAALSSNLRKAVDAGVATGAALRRSCRQP
jgi:hypothetical protein